MKTLSGLIDGILRNIYRRHGPIFSEIMVNWGKIVGTKYFKVSKPTRISYIKDKDKNVSTLHVDVNDSGSSVELSYQQGLILERIAIYFGYKAIDKIKFKVRPKA